MSYKIAVVGATGNVGRAMLEILHERKFPASEIIPLASSRSKGKEVSYGDEKILICQDLAEYDFRGTDIALFSPGGKISAQYAPKAAAAGCVVIDNTSHFRMMEDIPLIVPEVNGHALGNYAKRNIISNPNCSTIQMVTALAPLHEEFKIKRIVVATYQSVSGAGKEAMDTLYDQTKGMFLSDDKHSNKFPTRIAFNVIPQIDVFMDDGGTKEEWKMVQETKKILDPAIEVSATCVRVPVFVGHSEAINVEFEKPFEMEDIFEILGDAEGVTVIDRHEPGGYMTPAECVGEDATFVSRIRRDTTLPNGLNLWVVSDNLRKGAALNAVQIAEELISTYKLMPKVAA